MELNEDRRKKLEAGKEKLAAFRKKKAKRKKVESDKPAASNEFIEPLNGNELSPPEFSSLKDVHSTEEDSDPFFISSGDEFSPEEQESRSTVYYQSKLDNARHRISELEETVEGKQIALDSLMSDYVECETHKIPHEDNNANLNDSEGRGLTYSGLERALAQRDALIAQLTESLQTSTNASPGESELLMQIQSLAGQVSVLQNQLQQTDQTMQEQLEQHGVSSSAMQAAKTQMLQLESIVKEKDNDLQSLYEQWQSSQASIKQLQDDLSQKNQEVYHLSQKVEGIPHITDLQNQWHEQEKTLQDELVSKSDEINGLLESDQQSKALVMELTDDNGKKDEKLQVLSKELEELKRLKNDMERESQGLVEEKKELTEYCQNISSSLSDHNTLTAEFEKLTQAHSALSAEHEPLKSKCLLLENAIDELKQENAFSKSQLCDMETQLEEEQQRYAQQEKALLDLESRQSAYSDQLNNKLNDLQNRLSSSEESLSTAEDKLNDERQQVKNLQNQLIAEESKFTSKCQELNEQLSQQSDLLSQVQTKDDKIAEMEKLHQEYKEMNEKLKNKEVDFEKENGDLLGKTSELEKQLDELKAENKMLTEQTIQLRDDILSAQHVHGVEMSERDYREENMEEQMELMNEDLNTAQKRSAELESKLKEKDEDMAAEDTRRKALEDQMKVLESERDVLRETVQSLNADIGQLKEKLAVETKAPVEEKILAYENQQLSASLKKDDNETEEKIQLAILEEEMLSLKTKLDAKDSTCQCLEEKLYRCQSQHKEELEKYRSDILRLEQDLESHFQQNDLLNKELTESRTTLEKSKDELTKLEESQKAGNQELEELKKEKLLLETREEEELSRIKDLESEAEDLKLSHQMLQNREKELLTRQEAVEGQLEATIREHEKLQQITEQKESQLRDLQDELEEEKRKRGSIENSHENELSDLQADTEKWRQKYSEGEEALNELQTQLSLKKNELDTKVKEFSDALETVSQKDAIIKDMEMKLSSIDAEMANVSKENDNSKEEISTLSARLENSEEEMKSAQIQIEEIKSALDKEKEEKESLLNKLDSNEKDLNNAAQLKEELDLLIQDLQAQMESKQSNISDLTCKLEDLSHTVSELESRCSESNNLMSNEQLANTQLSESLDSVKLEGLRLEGLVAFLMADIEAKEDVLVQQNTSLVDEKAQVTYLDECLNEKAKAVKLLEESNVASVAVREQLEVDKKVLANTNHCLSEEVEKLTNESAAHEQDISQLSLDNKQLQEELKQAKQEVESESSAVNDLAHDNEILQKEMCDLKSDIEEKECRIDNLTSELDTLQDALHTSDEEKKLLKTNFDACMEDMQQKMADQDAEVRQMKCQLAEDSKSISEGQIEMKEMYEQQLSQLEDRLLSAENERSNLEREISDSHDKINALKESYENQMSELELSLQAANSECVKLNQCIAKTNTNHENEILDLNSLHEMQKSELLDNNMSLEKTVSELQKTLNENLERAKIDRGELEQSFEVQMIELDEKRRFYESEVARLKRHLDEMRKDHEMDVKNLEKRYETQMFEMEDKCSVMGAELNRARKSMMNVEGDFGEERKTLELKVDDLENIRRELEIKISVLEDDMSSLKEVSQRREDEMKNILKNAAEKQTNLEAEVACLNEQLALLNADKESTINSMKKNYENDVEDLETRNEHLEEKVHSLLKHAEEDMVFSSRDQELEDEEKGKMLNSQIAELKEKIGVLSDENISLKRRLLSHKSSKKKILSAGVEDICPSHQSESEITAQSLPKLLTSTPSKGFDNEECFSPTVEEVSMIEGFVAERDQPLYASRMESLSKQKSFDKDRVGEPDFVVEEQDRFQPEMVIEKVIESSEYGNQQLNAHPICEEVIAEGFQPEVGDQFLMETIEEPDGVWPQDLSVGLSPSMQEKEQFHFENIPAPKNNTEFDKGKDPQVIPEHIPEISDQNTNCSVEADTAQNSTEEEAAFVTASELARKLNALKESLEDEYVTKLRTQKRDLIVEYETKQEDYQREMELHCSQKAQSIKNDWERKFAKALQKVRKDVERRHVRHGHQSKANTSSSQDEQQSNSAEGMPGIAEGSEELDQKVQQLSKENQELAEARDELLKQIELSQAWGLHHRVQHELQSKISGRDSPVSPFSPTQTLTSESPSEEVTSPTDTLTSCSPEHEVQTSHSDCSSRQGGQSPDGMENKAPDGPSPDNISSEAEAESSHTEISETSSARERFLEEFADISQQSSQDLPLEWELTTTIADAGEFERNPQHGSVWEVFDGRCMRQDCQEVRQRYRRLFQFLVKCNVNREGLMSEESGLLMPSFFDSLDENDILILRRNSVLSDEFVPSNEEEISPANAHALNTILKLEREQLEEELSIEHLKRELYETLKDNQSLRIRLVKECRVREELEKNFNEELSSENVSVSTAHNEYESLTEVSPEREQCKYNKSKVDIGVQVDLARCQGESKSVQSDLDELMCKSDNCHESSQCLDLNLLEKEQALFMMQAELTDLKSLKRDSAKSVESRFEMFREELEGLKKEVQFKDKVIKNLREDLNRLIYPKPLSHDNTEFFLSQEISKSEGKPEKELSHQQDIKLSAASVDPSLSNLCTDSSSGTDDNISCHLEKNSPAAKSVNQREDPTSSDKDELFKTDSPVSLCPDLMGGYGAEAAGEGLAIVTQQDIDIATKQYRKLTEGEEEGSPQMKNDKSIIQGCVEGNFLEGSIVSSSNSSALPSTFSTPESNNSRIGTPLRLQDTALAEELNKLKQDLRETRAIYSKENSLLREALQKENVAMDVGDSMKTEPIANPLRLNLDESEVEVGNVPAKEELSRLRQRLTICLEQNKMLEEENTSLRAKIREQDAMVVIVKQKLLEKEHSSDEWRRSMNHQLKSLQQQRDDLLQLLRNLEDGTSPSLSETMGQAALKEESLRRAQEDLMDKMEELDHLHQMLTQRQIELQHCEAERRHLEQLCLLKDQTEMQLMKQKRLMEEQVTEIELRLRERETTLVDEKTKLLRELREKDQHLSQMSSQSARSSPRPAYVMPRSSSLGDINTGSLDTFNTTKAHSTSHTNVSSGEDVDIQHMQAIHKLKEKLKLEYELRAARVAEYQASAIASYWQRHDKSS